MSLERKSYCRTANFNIDHVPTTFKQKNNQKTFDDIHLFQLIYILKYEMYHLYINTCMYICVCIKVVGLYMKMYTYTHTHTQNTDTQTHTHTQTYLYCSNTNTRKHTIFTHMYTSIQIHMCMYVCVCKGSVYAYWDNVYANV